MFVDTQSGNRNFVHGYMTQADISRMGSNCDLVPEPYREITKDVSMTQSSSIMNVRVLSRMKGGVNSMLARLSSRNLNMQTHRLSSSVKSDADKAKLKRLQDHLSSDCKYNPFKFCNTSDNEKLRLSSFFTSIRDRSRYQVCNRAGTYSKETYEFNAMLLYDYEEYETRHLMNPMDDGGNGGNVLSCFPLCREQFDHVSKDFLSQFGELGYEHFLRCIKNTNDEQNDVQKWWAMFGRYWLMLNRHNDDDIKLMSWLMNGANHGTVNTFGENVNSLNDSLIHTRVGERVILGNNSRLLCKELGQQVPIKSRQKMNRDISKFMKNSFGDNFSTTPPPNEHRFWKANGFAADYVEPNTRNGFFDSCIIQRFFPVDPSPQT